MGKKGGKGKILGALNSKKLRSPFYMPTIVSDVDVSDRFISLQIKISNDYPNFVSLKLTFN